MIIDLLARQREALSMEETGKGIMLMKRRSKDESSSSSTSSTPSSGTGSEGGSTASPQSKKNKSFQDCGRERLKRHRMEMAGGVCIPETWGQESLLKDWVDRRSFESFSPERLASARNALVRDGRRANRVEIENRC